MKLRHILVALLLFTALGRAETTLYYPGGYSQATSSATTTLSQVGGGDSTLTLAPSFSQWINEGGIRLSSDTSNLFLHAEAGIDIQTFGTSAGITLSATGQTVVQTAGFVVNSDDGDVIFSHNTGGDFYVEDEAYFYSDVSFSSPIDFSVPLTANATITSTAPLYMQSPIYMQGASVLFDSAGLNGFIWNSGAALVGNGTDNQIIIDTEDLKLPSQTITGDDSAINKGLGDIRYGGPRGYATPTAPTGTTLTINLESGNYILVNLASASGNVTLTLSNPRPGALYFLKVTQGATIRSLIFPAGTTSPLEGGNTWNEGTASKTDIITLIYDGTNFQILGTSVRQG